MSTMQMSVPCTWPHGCGNVTKDPGGMCHLHRGRSPRASATLDPSLPVPILDEPEQQLAGLARDPKQLRDYQVEARDSIMKHLDQDDRCLVRAACGMGKTVIAQDVIREHYSRGEGNGVYVFITAGIQLTKQSRDDFDRDAVLGPHLAFSVHDDSEDLEQGRTKDSSSREDDVASLVKFLSTPSDKPKVIFSTYNSHDKIIEAQKVLGEDGTADLVIFDEAHRLGGEYKFDPRKAQKASGSTEADGFDDEPIMVKGRVPRIFHNDIEDSLQADKRVFLSATPKVSDEKERFKVKAGNVNGLRAVADAERAGKAKTTVIMHDDETVFGKSAVSWGLQDAVDKGALVPLEPVVAPVRVGSGVGPNSWVDADGNLSASRVMSLNSYSVVASTLSSLADDDGGRNVLTFVGRIEESREVAERWSDVARSMAAKVDPAMTTESRARSVLEDPAADERSVKAARLYMLGEYGEVRHASSKSTPTQRDEALGLYQDQSCRCGSPGGWCACARVVSNVDLFGQGINVHEIDTVVLGDVDKTGDIQLTQAVGRAMRRWDSGGKQKGRVVIPSVETGSGDKLNQPLVARSLYGISRLFRDSIGSSMKGEQMEPASSIDVRTLGEGSKNIDTEIGNRFSTSMDQIALHSAYASVEANASKTYSAMGMGKWGDLSPEERHANTMQYAAMSRTRSLEAEALVRRSPSFSEVRTAEVAAELLRRRAHEYDRDTLTQQERRMCEAAGILRNGAPGTGASFSYSKMAKKFGEDVMLRLASGALRR